MLVQGNELFSTPEVTAYIEKFEEKLQESNNKVNQLRADIQRCDAEIDACMEVDIIEGTTRSKKDLTNVESRKLNLQSQLEAEIKKVYKIKEIMTQGLSKLMPEASKQLQADMAVYHNVVEREFCRQLGELRKQQEELLLTLQVAHNAVVNKLFNFDEICHLFDMKQYRKSPSNQMFHNNLHMAHRSFAEYGSPLINASNLQAVEDIIMRARADANAIYNGNKAPEDKEQIPQAKTLKDIDLQKFLDEIK